ncbi:hypothetical protein Vafri_691 [Volvox africanus]|nr:hypothetical protein Vafri_691 [Volvox africanus]
MALTDLRAACKRLAELYKDDLDSAMDLMATLSDLDDDAFLRLRIGWENYIDSPAEKAFVTKRLSDMAAGPGPSSTRTSAGAVAGLGSMVPVADIVGLVRTVVTEAIEPVMEKNEAMQREQMKAIKEVRGLYLDINFTPKSTCSCLTECRKIALKYYTGSEVTPKTILCAISGICLPTIDVHAGHIYQLRWRMLKELCLEWNEPSNILFMHKNVEHAFDNLEITVLPVQHKIILLRQSIWKSVAFEYIPDADIAAGGASTSSGLSAGVKKKVTWGELNNKQLSLPGINQPSDVALGVHARRAFRFAVQIGWCKKSELPPIYCGDSEILRRFLADNSSGSSNASSGAGGGDLGGTTGSDLGESSQVSKSEGIGEV